MFLLYVLLVTHTVLAHPKEKIHYNEDNALVHFQGFIIEHNRTYDSETEKERRFKIFQENLVEINELNSKNPYCSFAINQFADLSLEEFSQRQGLRLEKDDGSSACRVLDDSAFTEPIPDAFDWRDRIKFHIKNQGDCGSCYAFAATGTVEAQYAIRYETLIKLSEQQILDCDKASAGCKGGFLTRALRFLIQSGGQALDETYPYAAVNQECHFVQDSAGVKVTDCFSLNLSEEATLMKALYKSGPLALGVDAQSLMKYNGGVLPYCIFDRLNHAVLLVGYGTDRDAGDYWVIKNSWGSAWGEKGYAKIRRGVNACGILNPYAAGAIIL